MKCKIEDIGKVVGGATPSTKNSKFWDGDIPWITPKDLSGYNSRYISRGERNITQEGYDSCSTQMIPENSILFSSRAPIGYVAIAKNKLCTNQGFKSVVPNDKVDFMFLYYLLKYKANDIERIVGGGGSTFNEVSGSAMRNIDLDIPELAVQKKIASLLCSIDDKIELNNRINDNLQQQSTALFDKFYNGLNSSLISFKECKAFGNLLMGQSPKGESYNIEKIGTPLLNGAADYTNYNLTPLKYTTSPTRVCEQNDLVFCIRATIGLLVFADKQYCLGRGVAAISKTDEQYVEYVYHILNNSIEQLKHQANGSVIVGINKDDILNIKVKIPSNSEIKKFHIMQKPIFEAIKNNRDEILRLTRIRDALLPKLMSGELDVSSIELDI